MSENVKDVLCKIIERITELIRDNLEILNNTNYPEFYAGKLAAYHEIMEFIVNLKEDD